MSQEFKNVKVATGKRSKFDLSHDQVTTSDFGKIIPIMVRECLPGDNWTVDPNVFIRLAPLAVPTYGKIKCRVHTFFVPNRIMWKDWDNYITGNSQSLPPYMSLDAIGRACFNDPAVRPDNPSLPNPNKRYRGVYSDVLSNLGINPTCLFSPSSDNTTLVPNLPNDTRINAFPFLAYQRVWFDYFRDTNLNTSEDWYRQFENGGSMDDTLVSQLLELRWACYKKDYFTTAKLNPQDGADAASATANFSRSVNSASNNLLALYGKVTNGSKDVTLNVTNTEASSNVVTSAISIPALRAATALQRYLERNNYVGARTISRLLAHFGVQPSAERLDMAEYIGGSDFNVQIADVTSTSQYTESSPWGTTGLGSQAGKGVGAGSIKSSQYFCKEHGILLSVMSILPDTGYYQGLHKMWTRGFNSDGKFEYFTPEFENLGFQPILNREFYVPKKSDYPLYNGSGILGYTPRYSDYKFQMSVLAGDFVAQDTSTAADSFHLFRKLHYDASSPLALNTNLTTCINVANDYDRIFQVSDNTLDHFYCDIHVNASAERNMVDFAEPSIADVQDGEGRKVELPYGGVRL